MNALHVWIPLVAFVVAVARAENTNSLPTGSVTSNTIPSSASNTAASTSITIDGVTYQDVRWGRLTPATVTIYHKSGIAAIPLWKLPPDVQQRFGYDPQKAAEWQKREAAADAAWRASLAKQQAAIKAANEAKAAAERAANYSMTAHPGQFISWEGPDGNIYYKQVPVNGPPEIRYDQGYEVP